eukprot:scaffold23518_cov225-Skeletonema_marinoi.AAC.10
MPASAPSTNRNCRETESSFLRYLSTSSGRHEIVLGIIPTPNNDAAVCSRRVDREWTSEIGGPSHGHYDICTCAKELSLCENDSFHSTHCSAIFDNTPPAEPDFTNHISVSACNVSGQDTIDENSPNSIDNDCSAFFDNTGLVNTQHTTHRPSEPDFTNHISVSACNVSGQDENPSINNNENSQSQPYAHSLFFGPQPLFS